MVRAALGLFAGLTLAAVIGVPAYFYEEGYRLLIITPRENVRWDYSDQLLMQRNYPGGQWAREDYYRCEQTYGEPAVWVIYKANHDRIVTDRGCWW